MDVCIAIVTLFFLHLNIVQDGQSKAYQLGWSTNDMCVYMYIYISINDAHVTLISMALIKIINS